MPPYALPEAGVVSGLKSQTHKGQGFNEMSMDDTAGKEKVTIHAQYDMNTTVLHDSTETIKNNAKIEITEGTYNHDVKTGTATYHVQSALTENYDATQTTTVKGNLAISSSTGSISVVSNAQHVFIQSATSIQLQVGASIIWMDVGGQIRIQGTNIAIHGSESVSISGAAIRSAADREHETKGNIVTSDGQTSNTVKGGMLMLNP
jgi:type VI secretion system secreted protein VgrG